MRIAHLPPLIEPIPKHERESPGREEFLVCDGNHRIIQLCWKASSPGESSVDLRAVLIRNPSHPYYAFPYSANEWHIPAEEHILESPPDLYSKYVPRRYPADDSRESYQAYYRDFNQGFKNVGGQGGRII